MSEAGPSMPGAENSPAERPGRRAWVWPYVPSTAVQASLRRFVERLSLAMAARWTMPAAAVLAGTAPLALAYAAHLPQAQAITAVLLVILLLPAAAEGRPARGLATMGLVFLAHSVLAIALAARDPTTQAVLPGAQKYWEQAHHWIVSGENPEYDTATWVPIHLRTLAGVAVASYFSLGAIAYQQGFQQVDMMNFYVGRLLAGSHSPWTALALGWHPWSLCRAAGMALISFEIVSVSVQRLAGFAAAGAAGRRRRCLAGLLLLVLDALLKLTILEGVRQGLADNLA